MGEGKKKRGLVESGVGIVEERAESDKLTPACSQMLVTKVFIKNIYLKAGRKKETFY